MNNLITIDPCEVTRWTIRFVKEELGFNFIMPYGCFFIISKGDCKVAFDNLYIVVQPTCWCGECRTHYMDNINPVKLSDIVDSTSNVHKINPYELGNYFYKENKVEVSSEEYGYSEHLMGYPNCISEQVCKDDRVLLGDCLYSLISKWLEVAQFKSERPKLFHRYVISSNGAVFLTPIKICSDDYCNKDYYDIDYIEPMNNIAKTFYISNYGSKDK